MKLEELRKLCDEATRGPWLVTTIAKEHFRIETLVEPDIFPGGRSDEDLIAAARNAMPRLLEIAEAAEQAYHAMVAGADLEAIETLEKALKEAELV